MQPTMAQIVRFRHLAFLNPLILLILLVTTFRSHQASAAAGDSITSDDHNHPRLLDVLGNEGLGERSETGFEHLLERYEPEFAGADRSIIGRAGDDVQALANNQPGTLVIAGGQAQFWTFPSKALLGPKSPQTPGLPSHVGQRDLSDSLNSGPLDELRKRQSAVTLYISFNTCVQPALKDPNQRGGPNQLMLYVSTTASNQKPDAKTNNYRVPIDGGFGSLNISVTSDVYFGVSAPASGDSTDTYAYELTASIDAFYASYNDTSNTLFIDSDSNAALLYTKNTTNATSNSSIQQWIRSPPAFNIYLRNQEDHTLVGMQKSMCALMNYSTPASVVTDMTTIGDGGPKQRFYVKNLNGSSAYDASTTIVGNSTNHGGGIVGGGGTVWKSTSFNTKSDNNCAVVFNLTFCDQVAYAVPSNLTMNSDIAALGQLYDQNISSYWQNFSLSLQQIPCNTSSSARYSLARNCDDCAKAYRQWLCAITMPRCQDFSNKSSYLMPRAITQPFLNSTTGAKFANDPILNDTNKNKTYYNSSRNAMIDEQIKPGPYKEVLPCEDLCYGLTQSCPASMQFACPLNGYGLNYAYGKLHADGAAPGEVTCNFPGAGLLNAASSVRGFAVMAAPIAVGVAIMVMTM